MRQVRGALRLRHPHAAVPGRAGRAGGEGGGRKLDTSGPAARLPPGQRGGPAGGGVGGPLPRHQAQGAGARAGGQEEDQQAVHRVLRTPR